MLSNATNQPKSTVELGYMCPRGLSGPPAVNDVWNVHIAPIYAKPETSFYHVIGKERTNNGKSVMAAVMMDRCMNTQWKSDTSMKPFSCQI